MVGNYLTVFRSQQLNASSCQKKDYDIYHNLKSITFSSLINVNINSAHLWQSMKLLTP